MPGRSIPRCSSASPNTKASTEPVPSPGPPPPCPGCGGPFFDFRLPMIQLYRLSETAAAWAAKAGAVCALLAGLVTCADIVIPTPGGEGIIGTVDITQIMIVAPPFLTIPYALIPETHLRSKATVGWE